MARSRNIKPGFFANEDLAECEPLARILFAGLWCMADREGRLEDRPKRIRAEILRYDTCDAEPLLEQLQTRGFIDRYEHEGVRYIQVIKFGAHQNPHKKEAKSTIPAPAWMVASSGDSDASTEEAPDEHSASPVQEQEKHPESPADSLIPDSLIPDSSPLIPDSGSLIPEETRAADAAPMVPEPRAPKKPRKTPWAEIAAMDLPDWLPRQTWTDWVQHRVAVSAPLTERAAELSIQKLDAFRQAGHDPVAIIDASVMSGKWTDLYAPKPEARASPAGVPANYRQAENERRGDEFLRLIGAADDPNTIDMEFSHARR